MPERGECSDVLYALRRVRQVRSGRPVLHDVTLEIGPGEITVMVGPSGAGKTSLLRLLNRLDDPVEGEIDFEGRPIGALPVREVRRRVGFVFQLPVVFPGTVRENLLTAAELAGIDPGAREAEARRSMDRAELEAGLLERDADELSVGQKQRVNLARALVSRPEVLVLDEPTSALDPATSARLMRTIGHLCSDGGRTVILATHRLDEATAFGDRGIRLEDGRVTDVGPASGIGAAPGEA